jgi:hypothetical protein
MVMAGPQGGGVGDLGVPIINTRNIDGGPPREVLMEIRGHSPSTLKNIDGGLHGEVVTEILERPPSTLKNIDGGPPLGGADGDPGVPTINSDKCQLWAPWPPRKGPVSIRDPKGML